MQKVKTKELAEDSPFKAKGYTVVKQWSFDDSKFKRVARPDIYKSSMNKSFYEVLTEEREKRRKEKEEKRLQETGLVFSEMYLNDENSSLRPQTALPSPSYMRQDLTTKVWSKRPFSARCENPGCHTPRRPFFTTNSQSFSTKFKEQAEERIVYSHELDSQSNLVQTKRFMLERITGKEKKRTLSRPQSAEWWRRHHYGSNRNKSGFNDLLSIRSIKKDPNN